MFLGMPVNPLTGSLGLAYVGSRFCTLTWIGLRPDWMALRDGEQNL